MRVRWILAVGLLASLLAFTGTLAAQNSPSEDDLPEGEGKALLVEACSSCHELREVTKFRGYYSRAQWREIVLTMQEYGAPVDEAQVEVLSDYLGTHFGRGQ